MEDKLYSTGESNGKPYSNGTSNGEQGQGVESNALSRLVAMLPLFSASVAFSSIIVRLSGCCSYSGVNTVSKQCDGNSVPLALLRMRVNELNSLTIARRKPLQCQCRHRQARSCSKATRSRP